MDRVMMDTVRSLKSLNPSLSPLSGSEMHQQMLAAGFDAVTVRAEIRSIRTGGRGCVRLSMTPPSMAGRSVIAER